MNKKADLQIMETIMVVIILVVLILVGMTFFYKYMMSSIDNDNIEYQKKIFDNSIFTFPQQAEVSCSQGGAKESCMDAYKVIGFMKTYNVKVKGFNPIYGYKNITLEIVYPKPEKKSLCTDANLRDCSTYLLYLNVPADAGKDKRVKTTPISVYLPQTKEYAIGLLTITGYKIGA